MPICEICNEHVDKLFAPICHHGLCKECIKKCMKSNCGACKLETYHSYDNDGHLVVSNVFDCYHGFYYVCPFCRFTTNVSPSQIFHILPQGNSAGDDNVLERLNEILKVTTEFISNAQGQQAKLQADLGPLSEKHAKLKKEISDMEKVLDLHKEKISQELNSKYKDRVNRHEKDYKNRMKNLEELYQDEKQYIYKQFNSMVEKSVREKLDKEIEIAVKRLEDGYRELYDEAHKTSCKVISEARQKAERIVSQARNERKNFYNKEMKRCLKQVGADFEDFKQWLFWEKY